VELDWRGFEIHPETPRGGTNLEHLFPGRAQAMQAHVQQVARRFGVAQLRARERINNSRRVLGVAEWARDQGKLLAFREAAMEAYWQRGEDLEDAGVLAKLAEHAGLPAEGAREAMDAPRYQARVDTLAAEGRAAGVRGTPTVFIGNIRVAGCQPYEAFAEAARQAGARRRS
jgi:predicted DsbA family dithiol-disulfide isomerase